jgi:hypothetical protein
MEVPFRRISNRTTAKTGGPMKIIAAIFIA